MPGAHTFIQINRLKSENKKLTERNVKLRALIDEVLSTGHDSECNAGISEKYKCDCYHSIITEGLAKLTSE